MYLLEFRIGLNIKIVILSILIVYKVLVHVIAWTLNHVLQSHDRTELYTVSMQMLF